MAIGAGEYSRVDCAERCGCVELSRGVKKNPFHNHHSMRMEQADDVRDTELQQSHDAPHILEEYLWRLSGTGQRNQRGRSRDLNSLRSDYDVYQDANRIRYRIARLLDEREGSADFRSLDKASRQRLGTTAFDTVHLLEHSKDDFERPLAGSEYLEQFYRHMRGIALHASPHRKHRNKAVAPHDVPDFVEEMRLDRTKSHQEGIVSTLGTYIHLLQVGAYEQFEGDRTPGIRVADLEDERGYIRDGDPKQREMIRRAVAEAEVLLVLIERVPPAVRERFNELREQLLDLLHATGRVRGETEAVRSGERQQLFQTMSRTVYSLSQCASQLRQAAQSPDTDQKLLFSHACAVAKYAHDGWAIVNDNLRKLRILPHDVRHLSRETSQLDGMIAAMTDARESMNVAVQARPDVLQPEVMEQINAFFDTLAYDVLKHRMITVPIEEKRTEEVVQSVDTALLGITTKLASKLEVSQQLDRDGIRADLAAVQSKLAEVVSASEVLRPGSVDPSQGVRVTIGTIKVQLSSLFSNATLRKKRDTESYRAIEGLLNGIDEALRHAESDASQEEIANERNRNQLIDSLPSRVGYRRILGVLDLWNRAA